MRCLTLALLSLLVLSSMGAAPWEDQARKIREEKAAQQKQVDDVKVALSRRVALINYNSAALGDVIDAFRDIAGANIHVNWRALEPLGIDRKTAVTIHLNNVSLRKVLKTVLKDLGGGAELATFYIDEGVIEVTTREIADRQLITKVYPVEDLVMEVPNFAGPTAQTSTGGGGGRFGGSGGTRLFSENTSDTNTQNEQPRTKAERAAELVALIKETVKPDIWRDNGGTASVAYFNGHLVVTAPRSVHEELGGSSE